jgi:hypothetical protein
VADPAPGDRFAAAIAAIDEANAGDPLALEHGRRAAAWVLRLDPGADEAQLLAARAHHLRRAAVPRSSYPDGRAGYLRWRRDAKERHAIEVAELLAAAGYEAELVARVQALVRKATKDAAAQVHEDAACLVFLETQLDPVADQLGDDHTVEVLRKTARKMSPDGLAAAAALPLTPRGSALLERALAGGDT